MNTSASVFSVVPWAMAVTLVMWGIELGIYTLVRHLRGCASGTCGDCRSCRAIELLRAPARRAPATDATLVAGAPTTVGPGVPPHPGLASTPMGAGPAGLRPSGSTPGRRPSPSVPTRVKPGRVVMATRPGPSVDGCGRIIAPGAAPIGLQPRRRP